jgi:hypothetical protein
MSNCTHRTGVAMAANVPQIAPERELFRRSSRKSITLVADPQAKTNMWYVKIVNLGPGEIIMTIARSVGMTLVM